MKIFLFSAIFFFISLFCSEAKGQTIPGSPQLFEKHLFIVQSDTLPYRLLRPVMLDSDSDSRFPLIIFFHGAGERGTDNERQLILCSKLFTDSASLHDYPCYVLAPQCPKGKRWAEMDWGADSGKMTPKPSWAMNLTIDLVAQIRKMKHVDTNRVYVTGLSMGGFGTWDFAIRKKEWVAAIAPVCGGGDESKVTVLKNTPVWAFHGLKDKVVKPARTIRMIHALEKAGGKPRLKLYPDAEHNSWLNAYSEPEFLSWLFAQHL